MKKDKPKNIRHRMSFLPVSVLRKFLLNCLFYFNNYFCCYFQSSSFAQSNE